MRTKLAFALLLWSVIAQAQTSLPTAWNFSNPGITAPPNGWTLMNTLPASTGGQTYAFGTGDNLSCRFDAQGEYLMIEFADKPGPLSYYVSPQNAGNPWSGLFEVQQSTNGANWSTVRSFTSTTTTVTNFTNGKNTDNLSSTTRFVRFIFSTKTAGNFALDSVLIQAAPPPVTPAINLKKGTNNVVTGSTVVIGNASATAFTIENKGTAQTLYISNARLSGGDSADFTLSNMPDSVPANSSKLFNVNFTASQNGTRKTVLHIQSNDPDKGDYPVELYAIGGNYASEPTAAPVNLSYANLKACGFDVSFQAPATAPEHYIVLRKRGAVTEIPVDGVTYKKGDYIGQAQVAYIGDSPTTLKPTYILANNIYGFRVFSFNGPSGYENYLTSSSTGSLVSSMGKNIGNYYNGINSGVSAFVTALSQRINPHDTIFYSQYISRFVDPFITRDTTGGKKVVNCVYTTLPNVYSDPFVWWNGTNSGTLTREHSYPQSWMPSRSIPTWPNAANGKELPEYNDLHHLFPADQTNGNGVRSNYPFGEVVSNAQPSPTGMGILGKDANGATVYEPRDAHKGDVARALFYMCTAYNGINGNNWSLPASQDQDVLKKWHFQDLPDEWEVARHEFVFGQQHNRNPFIDSVNFACRIDFRTMTWIANPGPCGVADPQLQITSPIGGEIWFNNNNQMNDITWTSAAIDTIQIELWTNDTLHSIIQGSVPAASGIYKWTLNPIDYSVTDKARIRLKHLRSPKFSQSAGYFSIQTIIGMEEVLTANEVTVYPNPSNGILRIDVLPGIALKQVIIRDITGKALGVFADLQNGKVNVQIPNAGVYLAEVITDHGTAVKKIVVE